MAGDMLPNSTERAITIAGIPQSIIECVKQICVVMLEVGPLLGPVPQGGQCCRGSRCPWRGGNAEGGEKNSCWGIKG